MYGAVNPDYTTYDSPGTRVLLEVSPLEDTGLDHPVKLRIRRILLGEWLREGDIILFCDHYNPSPKILFKDKTYLMSLSDWPGHGSGTYEYRPSRGPVSTQVTPEGKRLEDGLPDDYFCEEVTEGFYETELGKRWLLLLKEAEYMTHLFPVTGTDNIYLMMPFYQGDVYISSGREFTSEEYESGTKVCIVGEQFAAKNGLKLGDRIRLPLYYADHYATGGSNFSSSGFGAESFLNADGKLFTPFEDSEYEIVGMYGGKESGSMDAYSMGYNEVIIPSASVKNSDGNNIVIVGPMQGFNTSFQIENGSIESYMEKWTAQGIDNMEITFYDRGYTKLSAGMENMKSIARILVVMGAVMVLMVLAYFTWLFILRQGDRTAIERSLGFRKSQSFRSMFFGIFLLILAGSAVGCTAGSALAAKVAGSLNHEAYFDTDFGNSAAAQLKAEQDPEADIFYPVRTAAGTMAAILVTGSFMAAIGIGCNLRKEPMELLGKRRE